MEDGPPDVRFEETSTAPHLSVITKNSLASSPFSLCVFVKGPPKGALGIKYRRSAAKSRNVCG